MKLTPRGEGVVAGLVLSVIAALAMMFNGGEYEEKYGEPVEIEQVEEVNDDWRLPPGAFMNDFGRSCVVACDGE